MQCRACLLQQGACGSQLRDDEYSVFEDQILCVPVPNVDDRIEFTLSNGTTLVDGASRFRSRFQSSVGLASGRRRVVRRYHVISTNVPH